jgi:hypothetical protein
MLRINHMLLVDTNHDRALDRVNFVLLDHIWIKCGKSMQSIKRNEASMLKSITCLLLIDRISAEQWIKSDQMSSYWTLNQQVELANSPLITTSTIYFTRHQCIFFLALKPWLQRPTLWLTPLTFKQKRAFSCTIESRLQAWAAPLF